jgi:hypothetical protein
VTGKTVLSTVLKLKRDEIGITAVAFFASKSDNFGE